MSPSAASLLHTARTRAGLTQRELAERAGTSQSVIARIESGKTSPSWETLVRLLDAAGFELEASAWPRPVVDSHMLDDVARIRALSVAERLAEVANVDRFVKAVRRG